MVKFNYPNWNKAKIQEFIIPSALANKCHRSLRITSGQWASHHISEIVINQKCRYLIVS